MSDKYRKARLAKLRLQDSYIDGVSEDDVAIEARDWHEENVPDRDAGVIDSHLDETIPF